MKTVYSFLLLFGLFSSIAVYPQSNNFFFLNEDTPNANKKGIKVFGDVLAGSNSLNTQMYTEVLIKPTFSKSSKSAFLDGNHTRTNLYVSGMCGVEYHLDTARYFFVRNTGFQALSSDKDFSELMFFGNSPFRGQKVATNGLNYLQANTLSVGVGLDIFNGRKLKIKSSIGLSVLNNYRRVDANKLELYTATDGAYLDVNLDGVSIAEANPGIQGAGLSADISLDYHANESNTISLTVKNINGYHLFDNQEIKIDTSFIFNGAPFDVFDMETSIVDYLDSTFNETINRNTTKTNTVVLPTQIKLKWTYKLNARSSIVSSFETISAGKFGMYAQAALIKAHNNNLKTKTSLGYGNFRGFVWGEFVEYRANKYSFCLGVNNLQAIVVPTKTQSYGLSVGLFKEL